MEFITLSQEHIYIALIVILAYTIRGVAGFGSGLIAIPLLALFLPLQLSVILISLLDYLASLTHGIHGRQAVNWRLVWPLLPFNIIGVLLAVYIFQKADFVLLVKILAILIFSYAIYYLLGFKPRTHTGRGWAAPAGMLGSMIGTLFGTGGPFYVIYLQLQGLNKTAFRSTFASIFLIDGCFRISSYFFADFLSLEIIKIFFITLPIMLLSLYIGEHIHINISPRYFQRLIGVLLLSSSITLFYH